MEEIKILLDFLKSHWAIIVFGLSCAIVLYDSYKKIPKLDMRITMLEENPQCPDHDPCIKNIEKSIITLDAQICTSVNDLDKKLCRSINDVKEKINTLSKDAKVDRKDIADKFELIHHSLGVIEGKIDNVPK